MLETEISYPFEKRYYYPHMKPADILIWERFITAYPDFFDTCEYDVAVGSAPDFNTTVNPITGGSVEKLYKRKIDVVARKNEQIYIIELKPHAGMSTIGQLEGYVHLYDRDIEPNSDPIPMIITDYMDHDVGELATKKGIVFYIV